MSIKLTRIFNYKVKFLIKHISENSEHLTQVVLNNPTKALKQFNDNARKLVAEPCIPVEAPRVPAVAPRIPAVESRISVVEPRTLSELAQPRILPEIAQPHILPKSIVPRVLFKDEPFIDLEDISSSSEDESCTHYTMGRETLARKARSILLAAKPRPSSITKRDISVIQTHRGSLDHEILAIPLGKKSSITLKELPGLIGSDAKPNRRIMDGELSIKNCSDHCYKKFMELGKMLEVLPYNDSVCKMCMHQSSIAVPANAVFYSCGHNFLCHHCAMNYWNDGKSCGCAGCLVNSKVVCPICSVEIQDVIKSYGPL